MIPTAEIFRSPALKPMLLICWSLVCGCWCAGCSSETSTSPPVIIPLSHLEENEGEGNQITVSSQATWTATKTIVQPGELISLSAWGAVRVSPSQSGAEVLPQFVGPEGTYLFSDDVVTSNFPLPSAGEGPAPCYCLMGKIGSGKPFVIGARRSWIVREAGELFLGINDFDLTDNSGEFTVKISRPDSLQPVTYTEKISRSGASGQPIPNASVVVFYVDGLRPDVVQEMAALGHLPNIQQTFLDNGCWMRDAFTAFPSDTITSNGTMWTGCFSDRHGLKGQMRFSRRSLFSESYLEPLGPNRSARLLAPQGVDKLIQNASAETVSLVRGKEAGEAYRGARTTSVPPIYERLRKEGKDWGTGILPMMTDVPPLLWTRSMVRYLPWFQVQDTWKYVDDANTHYATKFLLGEKQGQKQPVTILWLPETDSVSHKQSRGQFGMTRRTIAKADKLIGDVIAELKRQKRLESTYLMLVSDHGHHGGQVSHLAHFDLAHDFFYKPREVTEEGKWTGGGLGMSVRQHRSWARHSEDHSQAFVFLDANSDGVARLFLPHDEFHSRKWMGKPNPADFFAYKIADHLPPVNLVEAVAEVSATHPAGQTERPVDLVLLKLDDQSILISTRDRGQAVVSRQKNEAGKWEYRYEIVHNIKPDAEGTLRYQTKPFAQLDPLDLLTVSSQNQLNTFTDEFSWLKLTAQTRYPDSVVTLTRHLLWQENLKHREPEFAPSLVVTAKSGWYFGTESSPGTMHGYPFRDSMRASFFVAGPNIRRGTEVLEPCRLADLTPTILQMIGEPAAPEEVDGTVLNCIYQSSADSVSAVQPVFWEDVDLKAWNPLHYRRSTPSAYRPLSSNRPQSPWDINNIAYNLISVSDLSALRITDAIAFPFSGGNGRAIQTVEQGESLLRENRKYWLVGGLETLDVSGLALGDYNFTSLGNLQRANRLVDFVQDSNIEVSKRMGGLIGQPQIPGTKLVHQSVDVVQNSFWDLYRFGQRVIMQALDETLLNGLENQTDKAINRFRREPAEIRVPATR